MTSFCKSCGRKLMDTESQCRGYGPICWEKFNSQGQTQYALFDIRAGKDILLARAGNGQPVVNVSHMIVRHSPDGFEWGYGGSGPSDLALNILILFTDQCTADRLYQEFKLDFIANMPKQGGMIKANAIQEWLGKRI